MAPPSSRRGPSSPDSTNKFREQAQQALALARAEADRFNHNFLGTEHVLLGLVGLRDGKAAAILQKLGLSLERIRLEVENLVGTGPELKQAGSILYTPRVKAVFRLATEEAKALGQDRVDTEHLLLGLLRGGDGVAARVLINLGISFEQTRLEIRGGNASSQPSPVNGPVPLHRPELAGAVQPGRSSIDLTLRYDIYCSDCERGFVVYRNALFKGRSMLFRAREDEFGAEFVEIEQSNGQTFYVALHSIRKFCAHGVADTGEVL